MATYFVIIGTQDNPIYELDIGQGFKNDAKREDHRHLNQFIVHAALDVVEELLWGTTSMNLKIVDKFNSYLISAYVTASNVKFMLLHETKADDGIKSFFTDCHELYIKTLLNPLYELNSPVKSALFDSKVRQLAKKHL